MAILTWKNPNDGFWNDPNNWLGGIFPRNNPNDDVVIDVAGEITTTHNEGNTVIRNFSTEEKFHLLKGSLTVKNATLNNTFILGNPGNADNEPHFIVKGIANLNADSHLWEGTLTGKFNNKGTLTFWGYPLILQEATLNNYHTIQQKKDGWIRLENSTINTLQGAEYRIEGGRLYAGVPSSESYFLLDGGTLHKTESDKGTIAVQVNSNNGEIAIKEGTLVFEEGAELSDTKINIEQNSIFLLEENDDDITYRFRNTTIDGSGRLEINSKVYAEDTITFSDNTLLSTFGSLQGKEFINLGRGKLIIESDRKLEATLINRGIIEQTRPGLSLDKGTLINDGGTYKLFGVRDPLPLAVEGLDLDGLILDKGLVDGEPHLSNWKDEVFINQKDGIIVTEKGSGDFDEYAEIAVRVEDKGGIINVAYGTLALSGGGKYQGTNFIISTYLNTKANKQKEAILQFDGGHHLFKDGVTFEQQGIVNFSDGEIEVENTLDLENTIWGDIFGFSYLQGSSPESKFVNRGYFLITTGVTTAFIYERFIEPYEHRLATNLVNEEGAKIEHAPGSIYIKIAESGKIDNYGNYYALSEDASKEGSFWIQGDGDSYGEINNFSSGVFTKAGSKEGVIEVAFNNLGGTVDVREGQLELRRGGNNKNGEYSIAENASLIFEGNKTYSFLNTNFDNQGNLTFSSSEFKFLDKQVLEGKVNFDRGTYRVDKELVLNGEINWSDNSSHETNFSGAGTIINQKQFTIKDGTRFGIANELINKDSLSIEYGRVSLENPFTNVKDATLSLGKTTITKSINTNGKILNHGLVEKTDKSVTTVEVFVENHNSSVDVRAGELRFAGGGKHTNSRFQINKGSTLYLAGAKEYSHQFRQATFENGGTIEIGSESYSDVIAFETLDDVTLSGSVKWTGGAIAGSGSVKITDDLVIEGLTSLNTTLYATGNTTQNWSTVWFRGGTLNNLGNYTMTQGELDIWAKESGVFRNQGSFHKTTNKDATIDIHFENSETGKVQIKAGELTFSQGGIFGGEITIGPDGTLVLDDGRNDRSFTFTKNSTLNNQGNLEISARIITEDLFTLKGDIQLDYSGELAGARYRNEGNIKSYGGKIESQFANAEKMELLGYNELTLGNNFTNLGIFKIHKGTIGSHGSSTSVSFNNEGTFIKDGTESASIEVDVNST